MLGENMNKRELTQLISVAKFYLDLAESLKLSPSEKKVTILQNSETASNLLQAVPLTKIDEFFAHVGSASTRLSTAHEILAGSVRGAWNEVYPCPPFEVTEFNINRARNNGLEILLRDNIAHSEEPEDRAKKKAAFRKAALSEMNPETILPTIKNRYGLIAQQTAARDGPDGPQLSSTSD